MTFNSGINIHKPAITHGAALFFMIASAILMLVVLLNTSPMSSKRHPVGGMESFSWLVTLNETSATPGPKPEGSVKYGFGIWGWCEWGVSVSQLDEAHCTVKPFWQIPFDKQGDQHVDKLDLPGAIASQLSWAGFILVFATALAWIWVILLWTAFRYRADTQPPRLPSCDRKNRQPITEIRNCRIQVACFLRNLYWSAGMYLVSLFLIVPTLAFVGIAQSHYDRPETGDYDVQLGVGTKLLIVVLVAQALAIVVIQWNGLLKHDDGSRGLEQKA